jgi:hypothetical protein
MFADVNICSTGKINLGPSDGWYISYLLPPDLLEDKYIDNF